MEQIKNNRFILVGGTILLTGFLLGCFGSTPTSDGNTGGNTLRTAPKSDDYYERSNRKDADRREEINRRKRYSGPKCEGDEDCEEICKDIYNRRSVREDCIELSAEQVDKLDEIYEAFENPSDDDLEEIDPEDFELFVEIDLRPLDTLIGKLSSSEAKRVLAWIADDEAIAEVFQEEDDDYDLLKELLDALGGTLQDALGKTVADGDSFMEIIIDNNELALEWVHNYFAERCEGNDEEKCIFDVWYCEVMDDDDAWDSLIGGYEEFEEIVDEILDDYTTTTATAPDADPAYHSTDAKWWLQDDDEVEANDLEISGSGPNQLEQLCDLDLVRE